MRHPEKEGSLEADEKRIVRILGVCLAIVLLTSLLVVAAPASAATLAWSTIATPNSINGQLQSGTDVDFLLVAPVGETMFAYDNSNHQLYKSTDAGVKWTTTNVGDGLEDDIDNSGVEDANDDVVAMAISPDYANDSTVVAAIKGKVFYSNNGGKTFGELGTNVGGLIAGGSAITSVDVSPWYNGGTAILVGDSDGAQGGGVSLFTTLDITWTDLKVGDWNGDGVVDDACDVLSVAFSPNHKTDTEMLAVVTYDVAGTVNTKLVTKFGTKAWGADVWNNTIFAKEAAAAVIAFPDNYDWSGANYILVGTSGTDVDDVFWAIGRLADQPIRSSVRDTNVNGTTVETNVYSIAIKGKLDGGDILVGQKDSTSVKRTSDVTVSTVTWRSSTKSPTGPGNTIVTWSPTAGFAYAATQGNGSALSRSTDGGVTWNQLALIDVSAMANLAILDAAIVDSSTMFLLMWDNADGGGVAEGFEAGDYTMVFKTSNGGSHWEQIWAHRSVGTEGMRKLALSPNYTTDKTLFVAQNDTKMWRTTNAGETFTQITAPANITALGVISSSAYYTGHADAVYKGGVWTAATLGGDTARSIVIAADGTVFVGTNDGSVRMSTDYGKTFQILGEAKSLGGNADVIVVLDPDYASNKTIYAGSSDGTVGVNRWVVGSSTRWQQLDDDSNTLSCAGLAVSQDGSLYAASNTVNKGVRRSIYPTASTTLLDFESVITDLPAATKLESLAVVVSGASVLYAVASNVPAGNYGYSYRLLTFSDILAVAPTLTAPPNETVTTGRVALSWQGIEAPVTLKYRYQVATDAKFASKIVDATTTGTSVTVTGLVAGTQYWWRVFVDKGEPLLGKKSMVRTFTLELGIPTLMSPKYGDDDVQSRPMFAWLPVDEATSYELEFAGNADFENAVAYKSLTHTIWTLDKDLEYRTTYYWRVRAVKSVGGIITVVGPWSEAVFTTRMEPVIRTPLAVVESTPPPPPPPQVTIYSPRITLPPAPPPRPLSVTPGILWAIIIIGAVLLIVVVVLIVRTGRVR